MGAVSDWLNEKRKKLSDAGFNRHFFDADLAKSSINSLPEAVNKSSSPFMIPAKYVVNQVSKPITEGIANYQVSREQGKGKIRSAGSGVLPIVQGGFNATPAGVAFNATQSAATGAAKAVRQRDIKQLVGGTRDAFEQPSSFAEKGLGVDPVAHPYASMAIDIAAANPKGVVSAVKNLGNINRDAGLIKNLATVAKSGGMVVGLNNPESKSGIVKETPEYILNNRYKQTTDAFGNVVEETGQRKTRIPVTGKKLKNETRVKTMPAEGEQIPLPKPDPETKVQLNRENANTVMSYKNNEATGASRAYQRVIQLPETVLKKTPGGQAILDTYNQQRTNSEMYGGRLVADLEKAFEQFSGKDREAAAREAYRIIESGGVSDNPAIQNVVDTWKRLAGDVAANAQKTGVKITTTTGNKVDFVPRDNYVPRILKPGVLDNASRREAAIKHVLETGQARTYEEAAGLIEQARQFSKNPKYGNLERPRLVDLPGDYYHDNLLDVGRDYLPAAANRIEQYRWFGGNGEKMNALIEQARRQGADSKYLTDLYENQVAPGKNLSGVTKVITNWNRIKNLDFSFLINLTQGVNTASSYGTIRTLKAYAKAAADAVGSRESQDLARRSGALSVQSVLAEGTPMGKFTSVMLWPFRKVEEWNRVAAANAGADYAQALANQLRNDPTHGSAIRGLERLGIDVEGVLSRGITVDDIMLGANKAAENTQFKLDPIDIPLGWQSDIGRIITQFKGFGVRQGQFLKKEIVAEARNGNVMPLMRLLALGTAATYGATEVKNKLQFKKPYDGEQSTVDKIVGSPTVQAVGGPYVDMTKQAYYTGKTLANPNKDVFKKIGAVAGMLGPTASTVVSSSDSNPGVVNAVVESTKQADRNRRIDNGELRGEEKVSPARVWGQLTARQVPFGDPLANTVLGKDYENKSYMSQLTDAVRGGDQTKVQEILDKHYSKNRQAQALTQAIQYASGGTGSKVSSSNSAPSSSDDLGITKQGNLYMYNTPEGVKATSSRKEAERARAREILNTTGQKTLTVGDTIYGLNSDGELKSTSIKESAKKLKSATLDQGMEEAKDSEDYATWSQLAEEKMQLLSEELDSVDSTFDPAGKAEIQAKMYDLQKKIDAYGKYKGFSKPKAAKSSSGATSYIKNLTKPSSDTVSYKKIAVKVSSPERKKVTIPRLK